MAQAPYSEGIPSVEPQVGVPDRYLNVPSTPAEFGGLIGRGEEEAGAGALKAAHFYGQISADNATNTFMTEARKILSGDPGQYQTDEKGNPILDQNGQPQPDLGFFGLRQDQALRAQGSVQQRLDELRERIRGGLTTAEQTLHFDTETRRYQNIYAMDIARHAEQEANKWYDFVEKQSEQTGRGQIAEGVARGNDDLIKSGTARMMQSRLKNLSRVTANPTNEMIDNALSDAHREAIMEEVNARLAPDPVGAQKLFNENTALLSSHPGFYALENRITNLADKRIGEAAGRDAFFGTGGAVLGGTAGSANYAKRSGTMGDPNAPNFETEHITTISSPSGVNFRVNKAAATDFEGFLKDVEATGYKINPEDSGGYNKRNIAGTNTLSEHAYGNAIDINAAGNPSLKGANLRTDLPANIRQIAAAHNLTWGGDWHDLKDAMHFEWAGPGGGAATARNNPGNIKAPGGGFASYPTPEAGVQAIGDLLQRRQSENGLTTIRQLIDDPKFGYAPSSDNPGKTLPEDAAAVVFGDRGAADRRVDMSDPAMRGKMVQAILAQEGNAGGADQIQGRGTQGLQLASAGGSPAHAPTREEIIGRLPEGLSEGAYARAYATANRMYTHWEQATSSSRAQLKAEIRNGIPMLEDGREFNYDPNRIRSLLPPDQADLTIDLLEDAKAVGQQKIAVRGMSYPEALAQNAANQAQLAKAPPAEYVKMKKMADAFEKAETQHFKDLFADPAGYLSAYNPEIERLRSASVDEKPEDRAALRATGQPTAFEKYASALTEEQDRLGVPKENQHVLGVQGAPKLAADIMANPSQAPTKIRQMEENYGSAWPAVWNDLASLGKMPTGYQALGVLEEADAEQLARGLGAGKEGKAWETLIGTQTKNDISKQVRGDDGVQKLLTSIRTEGASPTQIADFQGTIDTLAWTKQMEGDTAAASNAAKAFTSLYGFMPNGGARVPSKQFDAVSANAQATLEGLKAENLTIPPGFSSGRPGMPTADDYVRLIQGAPSWVNTQGESLLLMSGSPLGRIVRDKAGNPITVRFDAAAPTPAALPPYLPQAPF